jgi:hypothetical protein
MTDCLLTEIGCLPFSWGSRADLAVAGSPRLAYLDALRTAGAGDIGKLKAFVRS